MTDASSPLVATIDSPRVAASAGHLQRPRVSLRDEDLARAGWHAAAANANVDHTMAR